ncbi:MAG: PEP-CTERM sorting domain-containing protein [Bryobacteraceae bacterium]
MKLLGANGWSRSALVALLYAAAAATLHADTFVVTYDAAGVQAATGAALCGTSTECWIGEETFTSALPGGTSSYSTLLDDVGGVTGGVSGVYAGYTRTAANEYGGAGGTGYFADVTDSSYTVTLTSTLNASGTNLGVNYFGLWISALDADNVLQFYNGNTLVLTWTPAQIIAGLGTCPNSSNLFCGNPNANFLGQDNGEQFVFLNFYDVTGTFTKIVFNEADSSGFESDNHTVGYISSIVPVGTVFTPEPDSLALLSLGTLTLIGLRRRFSRGR